MTELHRERRLIWWCDFHRPVGWECHCPDEYQATEEIIIRTRENEGSTDD